MQFSFLGWLWRQDTASTCGTCINTRKDMRDIRVTIDSQEFRVSMRADTIFIFIALGCEASH